MKNTIYSTCDGLLQSVMSRSSKGGLDVAPVASPTDNECAAGHDLRGERENDSDVPRQCRERQPWSSRAVSLLESQFERDAVRSTPALRNSIEKPMSEITKNALIFIALENAFPSIGGLFFTRACTTLHRHISDSGCERHDRRFNYRRAHLEDTSTASFSSTAATSSTPACGLRCSSIASSSIPSPPARPRLRR